MLMYYCIATILLSSLSLSGAASNYESEHCPTLKADFTRRQLNEWSSSTPFTIADGGDGNDKAKHVPVLTISEDGGNFTIVVGNGNEENGVWHPQVASDDPNVVHFVTHIYAEDQASFFDGNVIYMRTLNPQAGEPATITTLVPEGVTELTPYSFCNLHGLWVGDTVSTGGTEQTDRIITCAGSDALEWVEGAWPSVKADLQRQQMVTFGSDAPYTESDSEYISYHVQFPFVATSEFADAIHNQIKARSTPLSSLFMTMALLRSWWEVWLEESTLW
eukprot:CCRYP_017902-RA/>CCRYP_017902-RA protein AED:0.05 eAED:0.05 QI:0/0/0.5/1/0/0.5/2/618/275